MRYLSQLKNGSWQFRFQIPEQFRDRLDHKCEYKRNFGCIDKSSARLLALEHELEIRKRMSAVVYNRQTSKFNQSFVDDIISTKGNEVKACILMCLNEIQKDERFKNALSLAVLNASSEANQSPSGCLIDVSKSGALRALRAIHPRELSAQARTDANLDSINFDSEAKASIEYDLLHQQLRLIYQIAIKARVAIELEDFQLAHELSMLLGNSSLDAMKCRTYLVTDAVHAKPRQSPKITLNVQEPSPNLKPVPQESKKTDVKQVVTPILYEIKNSETDIYAWLEEYSSIKYRLKALKDKKTLLALGRNDHIDAQVRMARVVFTLIGKQDMLDIKRLDATECIFTLLGFPKDPKNHPIHGQFFKNADESEWVNMNQEYKLEVISTSTVAKYIEAASTVYNLAIKHNEKITYNPFRGLASEIEKGDDIENKIPFSSNDLRIIFSAPVFTEHKFSFNRITKELLTYQYWMPICSLLTGGRPNELAQSRCGDVQEECGIYYWDINTDHEHKRLKNESAKRRVPIHPKLIQLGFIEFVKQRPKGELIFKELNFTGKDGYFGKVGEWFRRSFSKPNDFGRKKKSYYSFRHTFIQFYKENGISSHLVGSLVGHKDDSITYDTYGGKISLAKQFELIEKLDFDDVLKGVKPFYNLIKTD